MQRNLSVSSAIHLILRSILAWKYLSSWVYLWKRWQINSWIGLFNWIILAYIPLCCWVISWRFSSYIIVNIWSLNRLLLIAHLTSLVISLTNDFLLLDISYNWSFNFGLLLNILDLLLFLLQNLFPLFN